MADFCFATGSTAWVYKLSSVAYRWIGHSYNTRWPSYEQPEPFLAYFLIGITIIAVKQTIPMELHDYCTDPEHAGA